MEPMRDRSRVVLLLWVSLWMLMLPWVHVHPEVEHNHGGPGHTHHAVTHTLFSPPLECESPERLHHDTSPNGVHHHTQSLSHPGFGLIHPEIEFAVAVAPATPTVSKIVLLLSSLIEDIPTPHSTVSESMSAREIVPTLLVFATSLPLRAPPVLLS